MKSNSSRLVLVLLFAVQNAPEACAQESCCDNDNKTTLCYLSAADYCFSSDEFCPDYSLDGGFMETGLTQKLLSSTNFGPFGTVPCNLELVKLDAPATVQLINDAGCDIVFVPPNPLNPSTLVSEGTATFTSVAVLEAIRAWSLECENNLTVVTQGEAKVWGYSLQNANSNPNTPIAGTSLNAIFDGPFGSLSSFNQGGAFQGVFTFTPSTGTEFLAQDANGKPTVALDLATNDLMIGDVGIFCTGTGDVSAGPSINNDNDKLACNIFALACTLAEDVVRTTVRHEICPNETAPLPDGSVVSAPGTYLDTLVAFLGCDSIVTTIVSDRLVQSTVLNPKRCTGDGYSITVNGQVYDEANPVGQELLTTSGGCDSLVVIELSFGTFTAAAMNLVLCPGETLPLAIGGQADAPGTYVDTLVNFSGCDSVLTIYLDYHHHDTTHLVQQLCPGDSISFANELYRAGDTLTVLNTNLYGCDSLVVTSFELFPAPLAQVDSAVDVTNSNYTPFSNNIPLEYGIAWLQNEALSCADCPNPIVLPNYGYTPLTLTLTDDIGCRWDYDILVNYDCNSYLPNAFTPNGDGINDDFGRFSSGCPVLELDFKIFDRWGEEVFSTTDPTLGWNGNLKGKPAVQGVYVYLLIFKEYGKKKQLSGEVILVR